MSRLAQAGMLAIACLLFDLRLLAADPVRTDANIVTAIDISDSVSPLEIRLQIAGVAGAIRTHDVLQAIEAGQHGRVGFAVFAWSHDGAYPMLVSWTLIASSTDAISVSDQLANRLRLADEAEARRQSKMHHTGRLTDISAAVAHAAELLRTTPFIARRSVVNIISDGMDNRGDGPRQARDALIHEGGTINGVVLGGDPVVIEYFRQHIVGGPGAFVLSAHDADTIVRLFVRKLRSDIAVPAAPGRANLAALLQVEQRSPLGREPEASAAGDQDTDPSGRRPARRGAAARYED